MLEKPSVFPSDPRFSSGPCRKRPGWTPDVLAKGVLGRSHRSVAGQERLKSVIEQHKNALSIPDDWRVALVPGSDTGAMEMAMWNLLGPRGIDVLAWEVFGAIWVDDLKNHLRLPNLRVFEAPFGHLPDLSQVNWSHDVVFPWNGTTSGVCVPDGGWIAEDRQGLAICDATSALLAMDVPWAKLDVVTWSWQKALGSEAAHGMIALSPRALNRLKTYRPPWPIPKILRLTVNGCVNDNLFAGETLNTPSLLCVEDALDALAWVIKEGGEAFLKQRSKQSLCIVQQWVSSSSWAAFLAEDPKTVSCSSICLKIVAPWFVALPPDQQQKAAREIASLLERENVAYDIASYRGVTPGLRFWAGPTVLTSDIECLLPWLDWAEKMVASDMCKSTVKV